MTGAEESRKEKIVMQNRVKEPAGADCGAVTARIFAEIRGSNASQELLVKSTP